MIDLLVVGFATGVMLTLSLVLLITIEWRNWPLMGLLLLSTGLFLLGARSLLGQVDATRALHDELLWLYRVCISAGGMLVLAGLIAGLRVDRPPPHVSVVRVVVGIVVLLISGLLVHGALRVFGGGS